MIDIKETMTVKNKNNYKKPKQIPCTESPKVVVEELPYGLTGCPNEKANEQMILRSTEEEKNSTVVVDSIQKSLKNILSVDDYVIVRWNDRMYPGKIISMSEEGILVSCMKKTKEFWRWPVIQDVQLYSWENVICQIAIPMFAKKGCFVIPEINRY